MYVYVLSRPFNGRHLSWKGGGPVERGRLQNEGGQVTEKKVDRLQIRVGPILLKRGEQITEIRRPGYKKEVNPYNRK
jgi:hypothetical protein